MADTPKNPAEGQEPKDGEPQTPVVEDPATPVDPAAEPTEPKAEEPEAPVDWEAAAKSARKEAAEKRIALNELREQTKGAKSKEEVDALIAQYETKVQAAELAAARERAGRVHGLPDAIISRLSGTTEEELLADAEAFRALLGGSTPPTPTPLPPTGGRTPADIPDTATPEDLWRKVKGLR